MDDEKRNRAASIQITSNQAAEWLLTKLPPCLIMDILSRVPIKSLFICRCVCKTWLRLISDPYFVKLHLARSPTGILIAKAKRHSRNLKFAQIVEEVTRNSFRVEKMRFVPKISLPNSDFEFVNACNGLLCLSEASSAKYHDIIYVCNPILGEYVSIPVANKDPSFCKHFAFGFSTVSNQYKLLHTFHPKEKFNVDPEAEVYTIGTGQWRSIGKAICSLGILDFNTFLHGSIHWIEYVSRKFEFICAFDFDREQFWSLPSSPYFDVKGDDFIRLGVLNGCICAYISSGCDTEEFDIWVMKEYGIKESWTKQFVIENLNLPDSDGFYEPLMILNNGEVLMLYNYECVVCYNMTSKRFRDPKISQSQDDIYTTAYNPSFVSLSDVAKGEQLKVLRTNMC